MLKSKSKKVFLKRVLISVIYLILVFIMPWWLNLILGLALLFYFNNYYEYILAGLIMDSLYGGIINIENFHFIFTLFTTICTLFIINFKKKLFI